MLIFRSWPVLKTKKQGSCPSALPGVTLSRTETRISCLVRMPFLSSSVHTSSSDVVYYHIFLVGFYSPDDQNRVEIKSLKDDYINASYLTVSILVITNMSFLLASRHCNDEICVYHIVKCDTCKMVIECLHYRASVKRAQNTLLHKHHSLWRILIFGLWYGSSRPKSLSACYPMLRYSCFLHIHVYHIFRGIVSHTFNVFISSFSSGVT